MGKAGEVVVAVDVDPSRNGGGQKKDKPEPDAPATYEKAIVACGFGKFHYMLMLGLIPMCSAQLFSSGSMAFVLPVAECELQLEDFQKGTLNGATYLGNLASGLVWGGLADMFGRQRIVTMCFLLDFFVSLACSFAPSYAVLLVLKVLAGAIIAGPNSVLYAYLAEVHDDKHRSMSIMMSGMSFAFAQVIQPVLAYFLLPLDFRVPMIPGVMDLTPWRVFLLVCATPSLMSAVWFFRLPESPKFLMSKGRQEDALGAFRTIYAMNTGRDPDTYPVKSLDICAPGKLAPDGEGPNALMRAVHQFLPLFHKPYLTRISVIVAIQVNIMICINSLRLWTPQLFALMEQYELSDWFNKPAASTACQMISASIARQQASNVSMVDVVVRQVLVDDACGNNNPVSGDVYLRSVVIGTVGTSSFIFTSWASKKFGNRPLLLTSFPLAAVTSVAMLWAANSDVFMGLVAAFMPLTAVGLTSLSAITVDLFPTSLRSVAVSVTLLSGRAASLSGNLILPFLLNFSCEAVFIFIGVCLGVCSLLVWFLPKKPKEAA